MTPEPVKEKIAAFAEELVAKLDEQEKHGGIDAIATGRMTVIRANGWEYQIDSKITAKRPE